MNYIKKNFSDFLKQVNTNGLINSCLINIKKKSFYVEAIDETNTLIVIASTTKSKLLEKDLSASLGIPDLVMLIKFLSTMNNIKVSFEIDSNRVVFKSNNKSRRLNYLLADPEAITTVIIKDDPKVDTKKTLMEMHNKRVIITQDVLNDFQAYISMSSSKAVSIEHKHKKDMTIRIGEETTSQFIITIPTDEIIYLKKNKNKEDVNLNFDGEYIQKVFNSINFNEENPPILYFANNSPIVIENEKTTWAINPQIEE